MADIPVKPRRTGTPWWLWAVLAVVLIVLVWFALDLFGDDDGEVGIDDNEEVDVGAAAHSAAAPLALAIAPAPLSLTR